MQGWLLGQDIRIQFLLLLRMTFYWPKLSQPAKAVAPVRNRKKCLHNSCKRGGKKCEIALQTPRSVRKEREWLFKVQIPLQPMMQAMVRQVVPMKPQEDHGAAEIHPTACRQPNARACRFVLKTAEVYGEPMLQQVLNRN